jgi:hypothetical protein
MENTLLDASGNGNHLTLSAGTSTYADGKFGRCFSANGSTTLSLAGFVPTVNTTFCAWVKAAAASTVGYLYTIDNPGAAPRHNVAWVGTSNAIRVVTQFGNLDVSGFGGTDWTHVAVSITGRNVVFYKNGVSAGTGLYLADPLLTSGTLRLLSREGAVFFSGLLGEVQIYNAALAANDIKRVMMGQMPQRRYA